MVFIILPFRQDPSPFSSSYVGYQRKEISLELTRDTLVDLPLSLASMLWEIVVRGVDPYSELLNSQLGNIHLSANEIRHVPVVFGEPDLIKTLQLTPDIASGMEGLTGMYVRGGGRDENLFLLDGIPVYNVSHVGGLFSTFNPDMVKHVDFYKGSFPARYGGRLSSVIDVRLKDGDMQNYHGSFSIGLLAARAQIEGPLVKEKPRLMWHSGGPGMTRLPPPYGPSGTGKTSMAFSPVIHFTT